MVGTIYSVLHLCGSIITVDSMSVGSIITVSTNNVPITHNNCSCVNMNMVSVYQCEL